MPTTWPRALSPSKGLERSGELDMRFPPARGPRHPLLSSHFRRDRDRSVHSLAGAGKASVAPSSDASHALSCKAELTDPIRRPTFSNHTATTNERTCPHAADEAPLVVPPQPNRFFNYPRALPQGDRCAWPALASRAIGR